MRLVAARPGIGIGEGADVPGAILVTAGLMLAVYTILGVEEHGWTSARTLILAALSIALVAGFVLRQARIPKPLMPLRLFRSRNVAGANGIICALVVGMFGIFFLGALYMQLVLGYKPLEVGLAFLPGTLIMGTLSLGYTDKLNMRFGPRNVLIVGLTFLIVAMLLMVRTPADGHYWVDLFPVMLFFGVGAGVSFPALMMLAMSGATPSDAGLASGLVNTSMQVGGAVGLAILATLSTERTNSLLDGGASQAEALTSGYHLAYLIGAGLAAIALLLAIFVIRPTPTPGRGGAPEGDGEPLTADG
jgi:predicted MFS family arabinose efflux permease